jgi:hypothetical protein
MNDWGIKEFKATFFDSEKIAKTMNAAERKALSKMGAFVRTRARSSIRKRKKISEPGTPPSSHEGSLKRLLFFAYDASTHSVVIGPVKFKRGEAPKLLEFGGVITRRTQSGPQTDNYLARPFMKPAGEAEAKNFPDLLRNMVR